MAASLDMRPPRSMSTRIEKGLEPDGVPCPPAMGLDSETMGVTLLMGPDALSAPRSHLAVADMDGLLSSSSELFILEYSPAGAEE